MKKISGKIGLFLTCLVLLVCTACGQADSWEELSTGATPVVVDGTEGKPETDMPVEEGDSVGNVQETDIEKPTATPAVTQEPTPTVEPFAAPEDTYTNGVIREDMTSALFAQEMGIGINLGNTLEAYWEDSNNKTTGAQTIGYNKPSVYETCWGAIVTTEESIAGMKAAGFNTVRVPVYWGNMMANDGTFTINTEYMERVQEIVDYCLKNDLYVIINIHHYDGFLIKTYTEDDVVAAVEVLWKQIAEYFINYSDYLVFEGFNEALGNTKSGVSYTDEQKFAYVNRMNQAFVDVVRATGGNNANRLLIASGYWTNIDLTTSDAYVLPTDTVQDRLMVSVHYVDNVMYWTNKIGSQEWWDYSVAQCELLKEAFTNKGVQVFIGECTSIYDEERFASDATVTSSSECLEKMMNLITDYGFVPALWDIHGNFYDRFNYVVKEKVNAQVIERIADKLK